MTFPNLLKSLVSSKKAASLASLSVLPCIAPYFHSLGKVTALLAPPLREYQDIASAMYFIVVMLAIIAAYFFQSSIRRRNAGLRLLTGTGCVIVLYLIFWINNVHTVNIPQTGESLSVVTGFVRSDEANTIYPNVSDDSILESEGAYNSTVDRMWTPKSVKSARDIAIVLYALAGGSFALLTAAVAIKDAAKKSLI